MGYDTAGSALHHRGAHGSRAVGRGCHRRDLRIARVCPPISTGVVFLLPVLLVSSYWGLWPGLGTSVLAAAAFNFFQIEPTGAFNVADGGNWIALGVFLVAATVTSTLAHAARERAEEAERRRREADLTTEMARLLLGGSSVEESLRAVGRQITAAYGVDPVTRRAALDRQRRPRAKAVPLVVDGERTGTVLVPKGTERASLEAIRDRVVPALETLVAAAKRRVGARGAADRDQGAAAQRRGPEGDPARSLT